MRVLIIGAGTGGLCLAHGLKKAGVDVALFERDRTPRGMLIGYRVGISPDGSKALHSCLPPDVFTEFARTTARPVRRINMRTEKYGELLVADLPPAVDETRSDKSVSRIAMRTALLNGLDDVVRFDKTFTHFSRNDDGSVTAFFEDGTSETGDVLVGADGAQSRVRRQREMFRLADPETVFPIKVRTSEPLEPWKSSNVTMIGDSVHLMTPGRGIGANTALRDAELLCRKLTEAHQGKNAVQAISEYERQMVKYGFEAVRASREQMDGNGAIHKPVIGRIVLAFLRTFLRVTNAVPALKRKMLAKDAAHRDHVNSAHEVVHAG